jgi:hypothetical protein
MAYYNQRLDRVHAMLLQCRMEPHYRHLGQAIALQVIRTLDARLVHLAGGGMSGVNRMVIAVVVPSPKPVSGSRQNARTARYRACSQPKLSAPKSVMRAAILEDLRFAIRV